jgi:hypothetical protein
VGGFVNRNREHQETTNQYNPDLEFAQQGTADQMYGQGAPTGSWGMSGGQYPTVGKDPTGFGSNQYGNPYDPKDDPSNPYRGKNFPNSGRGMGTWASQNAGGFAGDMGSTKGDPTAGGTYDPTNTPGSRHTNGVGGRGNIYPDGGAGTGAYSQMTPGASQGGYQWGQGGYGDPAAGGSWQGGQGYQWGSGGAAANRDVAGGAQFGTLGNVGAGYARLGREGVTPTERSNLMSASNEAIQSNNAAYRDMIGNRAAQSGNTAGTAGALARLGATSGQQLVSADRANQTAIMQENQRRKEAGLAGQAGVAQGYGQMANTETGYMGALLGERGKLGSLSRRNRTEGTGTGGGGSISAGSFGGGG